MVSARSKAEAQVRLAARMSEESATCADRSEMKLGAARTRWASDTKRSADEIARVDRFVEWYGPEKALVDVRMKDVSRWMDARSANVVATTLRREVTSISSLFRWAIRRGEISVNPVSSAPKPSTRYLPPEDVPESDIAKIFAAVKGHAILEPAYLLALVQGLRRGEIAAAQWEDVDLERKTLFVRGTKTASSRADIPILDPALTWLTQHKQENGFIVRSKKTGDGVGANALQLAIDRFNAETEKPIELPNLHRCRHTCATLLIKRGVAEHMVTAFLRWASSRMLSTVYRHYKATHFRESLAVIESAFKTP